MKFVTFTEICRFRVRVVPLARRVLQRRRGPEQAAVERRALLPLAPRLPETPRVPCRAHPVDEEILQTNSPSKIKEVGAVISG